MSARTGLLSRRGALLGTLAVSACGGEVLDGATPPPGEGWVEFSLAGFPALASPGGSAVLEQPEALIDVWVVRRANGLFAAVWRVCTHGACAVEPRPGETFECPCHGSRFALDGAVLVGPAARPLRRYDALKRGDSLFLRRA